MAICYDAISSFTVRHYSSVLFLCAAGVFFGVSNDLWLEGWWSLHKCKQLRFRTLRVSSSLSHKFKEKTCSVWAYLKWNKCQLSNQKMVSQKATGRHQMEGQLSLLTWHCTPQHPEDPGKMQRTWTSRPARSFSHWVRRKRFKLEHPGILRRPTGWALSASAEGLKATVLWALASAWTQKGLTLLTL